MEKAYVAHSKAQAQERGKFEEGDEATYRKEFELWLNAQTALAYLNGLEDGLEEGLGLDA